MTRKPEVESLNILKEALNFNPEKSEINGADADWIILRGSMLRDLISGLKLSLGSRAGNMAAEGAGRVVGAGFADYLIERGMEPKEVPIILSLLLNQGGWGKADVEIDLAAGTGKVTMENCVSARFVKTNEPNCYFLKGYFRGLIEKLTRVNIECTEVTCMAKGDAACEFHLRPKGVN